MSHSSRLRKLASETAVYGISSVVGRMVGFALFPLYSHVFRPDEYGIVSLVYAAFIFLNVVYQYGMEAAYLKYASEEGASGRATFSTAVVSLLGTSVLFSVVMVGFRGAVGAVLGLPPAWLHLIHYAALILVLDTLTVVPFAALRLQNRPWYFAVVRLVNIVVNVGMNLVLIFGFGWGIEAVFAANALASAVSLVLLLPVFRAQFRPAVDRALWRHLLAFGLPFVPGGLGYALTERVNLFFLERLSPETVQALYGTPGHGAAPDGAYVVGVFSGCLKLAVFMMLVTQMFRYAWQPFFLQHARDADARPLFSRVFTLYTAGALFVVLAVSFFAAELVAVPLPGGRHLVREAYWAGLFIVPPALLGYVFQGWYYNFSAGAYIERKTRYFIHCTLVGSVVSVGLNAWLVPRYGMLAAAWATTLSYAVMALMLFLLIRRFYAVPYDWGRVLGVCAVAAALFAAWRLVPGLQRAPAEAALLVVYGAALFGLKVLSPALLRRRT